MIKPVFEKDYNIIVPHKMATLGSISKQIIKAIYVSDLVIANLTQINPNAMYELAIRHCIGSPVIIIAEEGTDLPFDVIDERTIFYKNDAQGVLELQERLEQCLLTLKDFHTPDSLIYDVLKDKLKSDSVISKIETSNNTEDIDTMKYIINKLNQIDYSIDRTLSKNSRNRSAHNETDRSLVRISYKILNDIPKISDDTLGRDLEDFVRKSSNQYRLELLAKKVDNDQIELLILSSPSLPPFTLHALASHLTDFFVDYDINVEILSATAT